MSGKPWTCSEDQTVKKLWRERIELGLDDSEKFVNKFNEIHVNKRTKGAMNKRRQHLNCIEKKFLIRRQINEMQKNK